MSNEKLILLIVYVIGFLASAVTWSHWFDTTIRRSERHPVYIVLALWLGVFSWLSLVVACIKFATLTKINNHSNER